MYLFDKKNLFIIKQLSYREKRRENTSALFGQAWQVLNPFINMVVLVIVFSTMFRNDSFVNFPVFCATGTWFFALFRDGTVGCLSALAYNKQFFLKTQIPKEIFIYEKIYVTFIDFMISGIVYFGIMLVLKVPFCVTDFLIIPDLILMIFFICGMGKILAVLNVVFPDITYFYKIFVILVFYASALFYNPDRLVGLPQLVLSYNPVYISIAIARVSVLDRAIPSYTLWLKLFLYAVIMFFIGSYIFKKGSQNIVAKL